MKKPQPLDSLFVLVTDSDEKLMKYVQNGNKKALEKLYERYKGKIFNFVVNMMKDQKQAEEITQDVFIKIIKNSARFSDQYKFSTWIFTIAKNTTLDRIKKKKESTFGLDTLGSGNYVDQQVDDSINIEMDAIAKADKEIVEKCLGKLKYEQKEALMMRVYSEDSYEEISKALDKSLSSVKSLINRAKIALNKCVTDCMEA